MFCYQQNVFTPTKEVDRERFWALVGAPYTKELIDGVRALRAEAAKIEAAGVEEQQPLAEARRKEAAALKRKLPAFIFQATFEVTTSKKKEIEGAWRKQAATQLNGLVTMDIDHVENPAVTFNNVLAKIQQDAHQLGVLLVYITPSGEGLKIVFKARIEWGNLIDNQHKMAEILGVKVDDSCKDASRMSFACRKEDILFINEDELFTYENKEFAEKYNAQYRGGHSQPSLFDSVPADGAHGAAVGMVDRQGVPAVGAGAAGDVQNAAHLTYEGIEIQKIIDAWLEGQKPEQGKRHMTSLKLAYDLRYVTENDPKTIVALLQAQDWVQEIIKDRGENVSATVKDAMERKMYISLPKRLLNAIEQCKAEASGTQPENNANRTIENLLPLRKWGEKVDELSEYYPCMKEICHGLPVSGHPAALFAGGAMLGTLLTRCTYHFYHRPEEARRLNYCIMVIGDPASGKSFANRLYDIILSPVRTADLVGYDALNRYKEETKTKGANKEKPKKPVVIIRDHPARTANGVFITDMNNAVETVDGKPMHLHLFTYDSELDNATSMSRGGQWIDKSTMELKAFHNEEDGQAYANLDSMSGMFRVYWNFVYTGTPLSLKKKVTENNFGSGLATRLAVIPLPPSGFRMMELQPKPTVDHAADETLKTWAFRLDGVSGELPLWPIVEKCWEWTADHMETAEFNNDKADEMLMKRVPYYGIGIAAPFVLMRHWEEWKAKKSFEVDATDLELCGLVLDIQYQCQHHFFGNYARQYFDNMSRDLATMKRRTTRYAECFERLPKEFNTDDAQVIFGGNKPTVIKNLQRLTKEKYIKRKNPGKNPAIYVKLKNEML